MNLKVAFLLMLVLASVTTITVAAVSISKPLAASSLRGLKADSSLIEPLGDPIDDPHPPNTPT